MILLTGANGFLGTILKNILKKTYEVKTLSRNDADYLYDITNSIPKFEQPFEIVIHSAGKAHIVPITDAQREEFYKVNTQGTINLLQALDAVKNEIKTFILISTVAVYGLNKGENIDEETLLNATDPYGHSKILAEKAVIEWGSKNKVKIAILRLPLIIGENPEGNLKKMLLGIKRGYYFSIGTGDVKKSMVLATDIASIIFKLADKGGIYNLTDGYNPTFNELEGAIAKKLNKRKPIALPYWFVWVLAKLGDCINLFFSNKVSPIDSNTLHKVTSTLTFSDAKAKENIGWKPNKVLEFYNRAFEE